MMEIKKVIVFDDTVNFANLLWKKYGGIVESDFVNTKEFPNLSEILTHLTTKYAKDGSNDYFLFINAHLLIGTNEQHSKAEGLELLKHIRLTKSLLYFGSSPIVIGTLFDFEYYYKAKSDNDLLLSPNTFYFKHKDEKSDFEKMDGFLQQFLSYSYPEDFHNKLKYYIKFTKEDESQSEHDNRNHFGPVIALDEILSEDEKKKNDFYLQKKFMLDSLWYKKATLLKQIAGGNERVGEIDEEIFHKLMQQHKTLLIDDEASDAGWDKVLPRLLYGKSEIDNKNYFESFSSFSDAENFLDDIIRKQNSEIKKWIVKVNDIDSENESAAQELTKANEEFNGNCVIDYDLVLLDLRDKNSWYNIPLNKLPGIKLFEKIKTINPAIRVIAFTASKSALTQPKISPSGSDGYWLKGYNAVDGFWIKGYNTVKDLQLLILDLFSKDYEIIDFKIDTNKKLNIKSLWWKLCKILKNDFIIYVYSDKNEKIIADKLENRYRNHFNRTLEEIFALLIKRPSFIDDPLYNNVVNRSIQLQIGILLNTIFKGNVMWEKIQQTNNDIYYKYNFVKTAFNKILAISPSEKDKKKGITNIYSIKDKNLVIYFDYLLDLILLRPFEWLNKN